MPITYQLDIQQTFSAAHAIVINGEREPMHGHDWTVTLTIENQSLDHDGLVCDFHELEAHLSAIIEPFRNRSFNEIAPFDARNPTAENIVAYIAEQFANALPTPQRLVQAQITEAPGCVARVVLS